MRTLLGICDVFASEFDIQFNASKSKFTVVIPACARFVYRNVNTCLFSIGDQQIEYVTFYCHLGHIITNKFDDKDDIANRRNHFIGQVNSLLCFFSKMDLSVKVRLFKSYCSSIYGCELWHLEGGDVENFSCALRTALRRLLVVPFNVHSFILPFLTDSLPILYEICKRFLHFLSACLFSKSGLVQSVARHGILFCKYNSVIGSNFLYCCKLFNLSYDDVLLGLLDFSNYNFSMFYVRNLTDGELHSIYSILELIYLREGYFCFGNDDVHLDRNDIQCMIDYSSSN